jgi:hypothetical protein
MSNKAENVDPRWNRMIGQSWKCASCREEHRGIFDLGCAKPDAYLGTEEYASNSIVAPSSHGLSEDFFTLDGQHVRSILPLPLIGAPGPLEVDNHLTTRNYVQRTPTPNRRSPEITAHLRPWTSATLHNWPLWRAIHNGQNRSVTVANSRR